MGKSKSATKNPAAVELSKLGARKGGLARAAQMSPEERVKSAQLANRARMKALSPAQRSAIARNAVLARWSRSRSPSSDAEPATDTQRISADSTENEVDIGGSYRRGTRVLLSSDVDISVVLTGDINQLPPNVRRLVKARPGGLELIIPKGQDWIVAVRKMLLTFCRVMEQKARKKSA
jgi:hypothetical protein